MLLLKLEFVRIGVNGIIDGLMISALAFTIVSLFYRGNIHAVVS
jgi:hypothetical protein